MDADWIVAGSGHNGLTTACYLARAGEKVLALDRDVVAGGGAYTREVTIPGVKHNLHAMRIVTSAFQTVYDELELKRYGVDIITNYAFTATVFDDGRALVRYGDLDRMVAEIARFDEHDARAHHDLYYETVPMRDAALAARRAWPTVPAVPPDIDPAHPFTATLRRWYFQPLISVLKEVFRSEYVRVALRGSLQTVSFPGDIPLTGLGIVNALIPSNYPTAGVVRGGTAMIARDLETILEEHGGAVRAKCDVREIVVEQGRAVGVRLAHGETLRARKGVIAGFGQKVLLDTIDTSQLPADFVEPIRRFRGEEIVLYAVHAAMRGPVRHKAADDKRM